MRVKGIRRIETAQVGGQVLIELWSDSKKKVVLDLNEWEAAYLAKKLIAALKDRRVSVQQQLHHIKLMADDATS